MKERFTGQNQLGSSSFGPESFRSNEVVCCTRFVSEFLPWQVTSPPLWSGLMSSGEWRRGAFREPMEPVDLGHRAPIGVAMGALWAS